MRSFAFYKRKNNYWSLKTTPFLSVTVVEGNCLMRLFGSWIAGGTPEAYVPNLAGNFSTPQFYSPYCPGVGRLVI
ncbi:MAG: hypothetical protein ABIN89_16085 [Chitinophagaceae bacterium]